MEIRIGDYFLTDTKHLYRIIDVLSGTLDIYYDLKSCKPIDDEYQYIRGIPGFMLYSQGDVIPQEKMTKSTRILYG